MDPNIDSLPSVLINTNEDLPTIFLPGNTKPSKIGLTETNQIPIQPTVAVAPALNVQTQILAQSVVESAPPPAEVLTDEMQTPVATVISEKPSNVYLLAGGSILLVGTVAFIIFYFRPSTKRKGSSIISQSCSSPF